MSIRKSVIALAAAAGAAFVLSAAIPSHNVGHQSEGSQQQEQEQEEVQRASEAKIREMMKLTGQIDLGKQTMDQMLDAFRQMPQLPPGFIDEFKALAQPEDLVKLTIPIIQRNTEASTVDAIINFAQTPEGKKWFEAQPQINKESMKVGQEWGQKLAMEAMMRLQDR